MKLEVKRVLQNNRETVGVAILEGVIIGVTLELPWRHNARNVSCIPHGRYRAHKRGASPGKTGGLGIAYELRGVDMRDGILIHVGNTTADTEGCLLLGTNLETNDEGVRLLNSKKAYDTFMGAVGDKDLLYIDIRNCF